MEKEPEEGFLPVVFHGGLETPATLPLQFPLQLHHPPAQHHHLLLPPSSSCLAGALVTGVIIYITGVVVFVVVSIIYFVGVNVGVAVIVVDIIIFIIINIKNTVSIRITACGHSIIIGESSGGGTSTGVRGGVGSVGSSSSSSSRSSSSSSKSAAFDCCTEVRLQQRPASDQSTYVLRRGKFGLEHLGVIVIEVVIIVVVVVDVIFISIIIIIVVVDVIFMYFAIEKCSFKNFF